MKNYKLLPIDVGFDDNYTKLSFREEAQELYLLLDKYNKDLQDIDSEQINEPNIELIENLVKALDSLNELEFIIALKKIQKLKKSYPINISFSEDLSEHYKRYAHLITLLKDLSNFKIIIEMLKLNIDNTSTEFISYIKGIDVLLTYFNNKPENLWEHLKHYRQKKYILNYDKPFDYLNWHIESDLFNELSKNNEATRQINVDIFEFDTVNKIATVQIFIDLKTIQNKFTENEYQIGFAPKKIGFRYIKDSWNSEFEKELVEDFSLKSKIHYNKDLETIITEILEDNSSIEKMIELQKVLISLHNDFYRKEVHKQFCKYKEKNNKAPCKKAFLSYSKTSLFCYECSCKNDLNAQRTRIHRENKAKKNYC